MYADRYSRPEGIKPGSLVVAVAINAAVIGALVFSAPVIEAIRDKPSLAITNIPLDPPQPPPPEVQPQTDARSTSAPERVATSASIAPALSDTFVALPPLPPLPTLPSLPPGNLVAIDPAPPATPVLVEARLDPRYARDLQPAYPAGERRAEREGSATVRVTIGTDGRVTAAECVSATTDAFCRASTEQALRKWRFRPATRDGAAVEASKVMTVRFELES